MQSRLLASEGYMGFEEIHVDVDAQTRIVRDVEVSVAYIQSGFDERAIGSEVVAHRLKLVEVGCGHHNVSAGQDVDGTACVVGRDWNVVCLKPLSISS